MKTRTQVDDDMDQDYQIDGSLMESPNDSVTFWNKLYSFYLLYYYLTLKPPVWVGFGFNSENM